MSDLTSEAPKTSVDSSQNSVSQGEVIIPVDEFISIAPTSPTDATEPVARDAIVTGIDNGRTVVQDQFGKQDLVNPSRFEQPPKLPQGWTLQIDNSALDLDGRSWKWDSETKNWTPANKTR